MHGRAAGSLILEAQSISTVNFLPPVNHGAHKRNCMQSKATMPSKRVHDAGSVVVAVQKKPGHAIL
jgi:hypothetical protein